MFRLMKASCEMELKGFEYFSGIALDNDTEQEFIKEFASKEEALAELEALTSNVVKYTDNNLVVVREYYIEDDNYIVEIAKADVLTTDSIVRGRTVESYAEEYGDVKYDGDYYVLLQNVYISGLGDDADYIALAVKIGDNIDSEGAVPTYEVFWEPCGDWENNEDESDNCDWDNPDGVRRAGWRYVG